MAERRPWLRAWTQNARGLLALAVCLALVAALLWLAPKADPERQEFMTTRPGEWATLRGYDARLVRAQLATRVVPTYGDPTQAHPGTVFVVVEWQLAPQAQQVLFSGIDLLTAGGVRYDERIDVCSDSYQPIGPGFTRTSFSCFEVQRDRLDGARMVLGPPPSSLITYTKVVAFDLGLDDATPVVPQLNEPRAVVEVTR